MVLGRRQIALSTCGLPERSPFGYDVRSRPLWRYAAGPGERGGFLDPGEGEPIADSAPSPTRVSRALALLICAPRLLGEDEMQLAVDQLTCRIKVTSVSGRLCDDVEDDLSDVIEPPRAEEVRPPPR